MPIPIDKELYKKAKQIADKVYETPSAYKSAYLVKVYKDLGGRYIGSRRNSDLKRWFNEQWMDVNPNRSRDSYPVYRPTKRINKKTPLTVQEVDPDDLKQKAKLKQIIRSGRLPEFKQLE